MKTFTTRQTVILVSVAAVALLLSGCADNEVVDQCLTGHKYGFFGGLWHGFIAPFDFIGMLFSDNITMYAQNNNGGLYALGFLIGSGGWGFFGGKGATKVRKIKTVRNERFDHAEVID